MSPEDYAILQSEITNPLFAKFERENIPNDRRPVLLEAFLKESEPDMAELARLWNESQKYPEDMAIVRAMKAIAKTVAARMTIPN